MPRPRFNGGIYGGSTRAGKFEHPPTRGQTALSLETSYKVFPELNVILGCGVRCASQTRGSVG